MGTTQLPLIKGIGKSYKTADYVDLMPVNLLATPKEVLNANGYLRSFPGIEKRADVAGTSRGVIYNTAQNAVYRVCGDRLYKSGEVVGDIVAGGRVSMAFSYNSHAVAAGGAVNLFRYDGGRKVLTNWPIGDDYLQYDIGNIIDICRNKSRYIFAVAGSDTFFVTDLDDESHPDRYRASYRAESQPDGIQAIDTWREFVVTFGTSSIEYFSLTGATDTASAIYVSQPSLLVNKGIAGTHCKVSFADSFAIISHAATGAPSVYLVNSGQLTSIATATIEKILRSYTAAELATVNMEALRFDVHELLLIHLPRDVLCYDATASQNGPQWTVLKTGSADLIYRGVDFAFEDNQITLGDKMASVTGALKFDSSGHYDEPTEHLLYTPMFKAPNARVFDFELEAATGVTQYAERLFISVTLDGSNYGREQLIPWNAPFKYDQRVLWQKVGRVRKNIGFKIRIVTRSPVTLSECSVRIE